MAQRRHTGRARRGLTSHPGWGVRAGRWSLLPVRPAEGVGCAGVGGRDVVLELGSLDAPLPALILSAVYVASFMRIDQSYPRFSVPFRSSEKRWRPQPLKRAAASFLPEHS